MSCCIKSTTPKPTKGNGTSKRFAGTFVQMMPHIENLPGCQTDRLFLYEWSISQSNFVSSIHFLRIKKELNIWNFFNLLNILSRFYKINESGKIIKKICFKKYLILWFARYSRSKLVKKWMWSTTAFISTIYMSRF